LDPKEKMDPRECPVAKAHKVLPDPKEVSAVSEQMETKETSETLEKSKLSMDPQDPQDLLDPLEPLAMWDLPEAEATWALSDPLEIADRKERMERLEPLEPLDPRVPREPVGPMEIVRTAQRPVWPQAIKAIPMEIVRTTQSPVWLQAIRTIFVCNAIFSCAKTKEACLWMLIIFFSSSSFEFFDA